MALPLRSEFPRFSLEWWESVTTFVPSTGCLLWNGFADKSGYCRVWKDGKGGLLLHRVAYECFYGPFDPSFKVCHACDNPRCVHPHHLFLGTQKDNLRDMFAKGRGRPHGHVPGDQKARVLDLLRDRPGLSRAEMAHELQMPKWRVNQILLAAGIRARRSSKASVAAALALSELASEKSHGGGATAYEIHLTRTLAPNEPGGISGESWRQVIGVPPVQPTQAVVVWKRPLEWTSNSQANIDRAPCWPDAARPASSASPYRVRGGE